MIKASFAQSFVDKVNRQLQIRVNFCLTNTIN